MDTTSGIRTHEAEAIDLKSTPFDRSGIIVILLKTNLYFKTSLLLVFVLPNANEELNPLCIYRGSDMLTMGFEPMAAAS